MKVCTKCAVRKPIDGFRTCMKRGKPYRQAHCTECDKKKVLAWRNANVEKARAHSRQYYRDNREAILDQKAIYNGAYYKRVSSPLAARAIAIFHRMGKSRRERFAQWILTRSTNKWDKAKRVHALDEWLADYSGV